MNLIVLSLSKMLKLFRIHNAIYIVEVETDYIISRKIMLNIPCY